MRDFYLVYVSKPNLQPLVAEISWTKNLIIMARCKDELEREFYLRTTARFGWTKAVLQHQVDNESYGKYLLNQTNFDQALSAELRAQAVLAVKDHYTFDLMDLADEHSERQLERALIAASASMPCRPGKRPGGALIMPRLGRLHGLLEEQHLRLYACARVGL